MAHLQYHDALCDMGPGNQPGPPTNDSGLHNTTKTPESLEKAAVEAEERAAKAGSEKDYVEATRLQDVAEEFRAEASRLRSASLLPPSTGSTGSHGSDGCNCHPIVVNRDENLIAHPFYQFLLWMAFVGGFAILLCLFWSGFQTGRRSAPTAAIESPKVELTPTPPVKVEIPGLREAAASLKAATDKLAAIQQQQPTPVYAPPSLEIPSRIEVGVDVRHHGRQESPVIIAPPLDDYPEEEEELSSEEKFRRFMDRYRRGEI